MGIMLCVVYFPKREFEKPSRQQSSWVLPGNYACIHVDLLVPLERLSNLPEWNK